MRKSFRFAEFVVLSLVLGHCMPDLDALQAGGEGGSTSCTDGDCSGGTTATGGTGTTSGGKGGAANTGGKGDTGGSGGSSSKGGSTSGGGTQIGGTGEEIGGGGSTGTPTSGGTIGSGGRIGSGGEGASAPTEGGVGNGGEPSGGAGGGTGTTDPCKLPGAVYTGFDSKTLSGPGILPSGTETYISSAFTDERKANGVVEWSGTEGRTCPGSFKLTANFFEYSPKPEIVNGMLDFQTDWTGAQLLHISVKVENPGAYLTGFQMFIASGATYQYYRSNYQNGPIFDDGAWHDFTLSLEPSTVTNNSFEPTTVKQVGIQILLATTAPSGGPTAPPSIVAYMDDIWIE